MANYDERDKKITWNSAVNNAISRKPDASIDEIREEAKVIYHLIREGAPESADWDKLVDFIVKMLKGESQPVDNWGELEDRLNPTQYTLFKEVRRALGRVERSGRYKLKENS